MTSQGAPSAANGQLLLADISGYTSFLQSVALAHKDDAFADGAVPPAYAVLSNLLDGIVGHVVPPFTLSDSRGTRSSHMQPTQTRYHAERPCSTASPGATPISVVA